MDTLFIIIVFTYDCECCGNYLIFDALNTVEVRNAIAVSDYEELNVDNAMEIIEREQKELLSKYTNIVIKPIFS